MNIVTTDEHIHKFKRANKYLMLHYL